MDNIVIFGFKNEHYISFTAKNETWAWTTAYFNLGDPVYCCRYKKNILASVWMERIPVLPGHFTARSLKNSICVLRDIYPSLSGMKDCTANEEKKHEAQEHQQVVKSTNTDIDKIYKNNFLLVDLEIAYDITYSMNVIRRHLDIDNTRRSHIQFCHHCEWCSCIQSAFCFQFNVEINYM